MRRFLLRFFAGIGLFTMLSVVVFVVAVWQLAGGKTGLPGTIVLTADLERGLVEGASQDPFADILFGSKPTLRDFLDALERAGADDRVKGLYAHLGGDSLGYAKTQEVRDAIAEFRRKGKFAIAFTESFGEFGGGTRPYYLATAFDDIWLQPLGSVGLIGLRAEVPFVRGTLDKLGISARFGHREEYKSASNSLTETAMTPPQREETEALLTSLSGQVVRGIAGSRKLSEAEVQALIDRGPLFADEAKAAKLVDNVGYHDQGLATARKRAGSGAELVSLSRYLDSAGHPHDSGPTIALIYGTGTITRGTESPLIGNAEMSAREITRAFRAAFRDADVRAIIFRIDSPGGSAVASETIWREVLRARERGKPVIVSMGDAAASGGYYVAAPADKIVAQPATMTGSIGVLAGKMVIAELLQKIGVTTDAAQRGANAAMFSPLHDFSASERQRLESFLDQTYAGFKNHVAAGRGLSAEAVEAVAKGRVWSGEDAKERGLVDRLGGYSEALRLAREAAKLAPDAAIKLVTFPRDKGTFGRMLERWLDNDPDNEGSPQTRLGAAAATLEGVVMQLDGLIGNAGVLHMAPIGEIR